MDSPVDTQRLAELLRVLAGPVRLDLLHLLRTPHTLSDIRLPPRRAEAAGRPMRPMSTPNVRKHILQLLRIGAVRSSRLVREGRLVDHFEVNRPQLFALTETMRSLADLPGGDVLDGTLPGPLARPPPQPAGPHLVLVRGLGEGRCFPLRPPAEAWTLGRAAASHVRLDYDGYVSTENARIRHADGIFSIEDAPRSRNGTTVNWELLAKGERRALQAGDLVGVGRSTLLFRGG